MSANANAPTSTYRCPQCDHQVDALARSEISHACPKRKRGQAYVQYIEQTSAQGH